MNAQQIRAARRNKGWSQEDLGKRCGVSISQISHVERGGGCTLETLTKILEALGLRVDLVEKGEA